MEWQSLYGGRLTENAGQAIARDVLLDAMLALDTKGWHIILSVHDEILTDERTDAHSVTELEEIMAETPSWAPGLPLKVEGWQGDRYRK
jgi:DNA polymerase